VPGALRVELRVPDTEEVSTGLAEAEPVEDRHSRGRKSSSSSRAGRAALGMLALSK
jgi:hypothetical protein